jgi:hypothetical protein
MMRAENKLMDTGIVVRSSADADALIADIRAAAGQACRWAAVQVGEPLDPQILNLCRLLVHS